MADSAAMPLLEDREHTAQYLAQIRQRKREVEQQLVARETLRHRIRAEQHLEHIEAIGDVLLVGKEAIVEPFTGEVQEVPLDSERRQQLSECAHLKLALMKKVLPDIKSVELTGAGGEELGNNRAMAEIELRNRLRAIFTGQSLPRVLEGVVVAEEPAFDCLR